MTKRRWDANGQEFIEVDGEWRPRAISGLTIAPFGLDTGIEYPDALGAGFVNAGARIDSASDAINSAFSSIAGAGETNELDAMLRQKHAERERTLAPLKEEFPVSSMAGQLAPDIASMAFPAVRAAALPASVGIGALSNALDYDPDLNVAERAALGAGGAAVGYGAANVLGRGFNAAAGTNLGRRISENITGISREINIAPAAARLQKLGGAVTPAQQLDDPVLRAAEQGFAGSPLGSRMFYDAAEQNALLANTATAKAIGLSPDDLHNGKLTEDVVAYADDKLGAFFTGLADDIGDMNMGDDFGKKLASRPEIKEVIGLGGLPDISEGIVKRGDYTTVRSVLTEGSQGAKTNTARELYQGLIDQLDEKAGSFVPANKMKAYTAARERWRNLKELGRLGVIKDGDVSAGTLKSRLQTNYSKTFSQNRAERVQPETAELFETLKALSAPEVRPIIGSSGTAERAESISLMKTLLKAATGDTDAAADVGGRAAMAKLYKALGDENIGVLQGLMTESPDIIKNVGARLGGAQGDEILLGD